MSRRPQNSGTKAGDGEDAAAPRPQHVARYVEKKIGPVVMEAFPFAGRRCERLTEAVLKRLGYPA